MLYAIAAYTETPDRLHAGEPLVGYLSINQAPGAELGAVEVTVRGRDGKIASVVVPPHEWCGVVRRAYSATATTRA